ncbi:MAG: XdhC family protein [Proteobacteria bacterium]|nr:XdhC family protein [Pseudomonadota bacterium]MBU1738905.1 XdhC family protein [Pseudomonadota bacterium]
MDDIAIYEEIIRLKKKRVPAAIATVIESKGSTPRKAGAKMLVRKDGRISGTVGGGITEAKTIEASLEVIRRGLPRTMEFSLTEKHGGVCGGSLVIYLEPLVVPDHLIVVGDGHVGRAVTQAARQAGFMVSMIGLAEAKTGYGPEEDAILHPLSELEKAFTDIGADESTYIFIATSDHHQDFEAVSAALATDSCYIAVIGSKRKKAAMDKYLAERGFDEAAVGRIISPAGLDIFAETPAEIAVSIVAQMIKLKRSPPHAHDSRPARGRPVKEDGTEQAASLPG